MSFHGDDLEPDALTAALNCQPSRTTRKGDPQNSERVWRTGSWLLRTDTSCDGDLDNQITTLLDLCTSDLAVWSHLCSRYKGRLFCGLFLSNDNQGLSLEAHTLARIGTRGLRLDLDIYGAETP
ncbi:DUF4279 domain-containing protein [Lichenicoccus sp.]|uniref:DUF4279 domain-containing protein n=1 Tax=Lichenicoccus sp. TaxID=2781899 RepID=UPI003D10BB5A